MRDEGGLLALEDDGTFDGFLLMPHILGNIHAINTILSTKYDTLYYRTIVVICCRTHFTSKDNKGFVLIMMPMNWEIYTWLHSVEHSYECGGEGGSRTLP